MAMPGDRYERLRDAERKATEGPFFVHDFRAASSNPTVYDVTISCDHPATITVASMGPGLTGTTEEALANAEFYAEARNQVRALLDERDGLLEALKGMLARYDFDDMLPADHPVVPAREAIARTEGRQGGETDEA